MFKHIKQKTIVSSRCSRFLAKAISKFSWNQIMHVLAELHMWILIKIERCWKKSQDINNYSNKKTVLGWAKLTKNSRGIVAYLIYSTEKQQQICKIIIRKSFRYGSSIIGATLLTMYIDSLISDDEPLWEPLEWSLWQTWLLFIFIFAWIAENLVTSRYGCYTGRDKRIWFAWYKALWFFELWWMHCMALTAIFIITPFYFELTYPTASPVLYWQWYTRAFFVKFSFLFCSILLLGQTFLFGVRWLNWRKLFMLAFVISVLLAYIIYFHFITVVFAYFTDNTWYSKTAWTEYACFGHEPSKWSYGPKERDHFTYHRTPTVFWYKNDIPYAAALMFIHIFYLISLIILYWQWMLILRRLYATHEISYTFAMYGIASLRHFYYFSLGFYLFVAFGWIFQFLRAPFEHIWFRSPTSFSETMVAIVCDYPSFIIALFV